METVVYSKDLEPITVLSLPKTLLDHLERHGQCKVPVFGDPSKEESHLQQHPEYLTLYCQKVRWLDNTLKPIIVAQDDELALSLKPDWLPGQQQAANWYKEQIKQLLKHVRGRDNKDNWLVC